MTAFILIVSLLAVLAGLCCFMWWLICEDDGRDINDTQL